MTPLLNIATRAFEKLAELRAACITKPPPQPIDIDGTPASAAGITGVWVNWITPRGTVTS